MSNINFSFSALTGGGTDSLDGIEVAGLSDGDFAFGIVSGLHYAYEWDASSTATENSPYVIDADDNTGNGRWILMTPTGAMSHVKAQRDSAQSIPNATATTVIFNDEIYDLLSEYNPTTGVFTATYAGYYQITAYVLSASVAWSASQTWRLKPIKNGSSSEGNGLYNFSYAGTYRKDGFLSTVVSLSATDTLRVQLTQDQGAAVDTATYDDCHVSIDRIV